MSYTSNYNLNQRISYLESIIQQIVPSLPLALDNILANGNSAGTFDINLNGNDILNVNTINGLSYPPPQTTYPSTFFVSKQGSDLTGDGSYYKPYLTIQKAITEGEALALGQAGFLVKVDDGTYTENLTITSSLMVSGMKPINPNWLYQVSNPAPQTQITGTITFTNTSGQQSRVYFNEIRIEGRINGFTTIDPSSTNDLFNLYLTNVWLFSTATDNLPLISLENSSGAVGRFTCANCNISKTITNTGIPIDLVNGGTNGIIFTASNTRFQLKYDGTTAIFNLHRTYNFVNCEFDLTSNNSFNYPVILLKQNINERSVMSGCNFLIRTNAKGVNYNLIAVESTSTGTATYSFFNCSVLGGGFTIGTNAVLNNQSSQAVNIEYLGLTFTQDLQGQYYLNTGGGSIAYSAVASQSHNIEMGGNSILSCLELEGTSGNDLTISSLNDLVLSCDTSGVGGEIKLVGGTGLLSASASGSSGQYLVISINGTQYKINLENP